MEKIRIETGHISGTVIGEPGKEVNIYRGVPYAAPPVGDLRWKPPQPAEQWTGIRECTVFSNITPQAALESDEKLGQAIRLEGVKKHLGISSQRVVFFDHHTCHAAYALFGSHIRNENTMIYTLDGGGDGTCQLKKK